MTYETHMTKGYHGHTAKSQVVIGDVAADFTGFAGRRILRLSTSKNSRGNIEAFAATAIQRDTGRGYSSETHALYGDYAKKVLAVVGKKATEKNVLAVHNEALALFPAIIEECKAFYADKKDEA